MESEPKYIEGSYFEVDDNFLERLNEDFDLDISLDIAKYLNKTLKSLSPHHKGFDTIGGVVHNIEEKPTFFAIDVLNEIDEVISLLDIREINSDDYLDLINLKSYLNDEPIEKIKKPS